MKIWESKITSNEVLPWNDAAEFLKLRRDVDGNLHQPKILETAMRTAFRVIDTRTARHWLRREITLEVDKLPIPLDVHPDDNPKALRSTAGGHTISPEQIIFYEKSSGYLVDSSYVEVNWQIVLSAGRNWLDLPADVQQAALILTAYYYRSGEESGDEPRRVDGLLERYRKLRIGLR